MSWQFNPPPGWPRQPEGWVPPPGWAPDPAWPPAPEGWQFWVPASPAVPPAAPPAPTATEPASPPTPVMPFAAAPSPALSTAPPVTGSAEPSPVSSHRPWFRHWWAVALLALAMLIGAGMGFGTTRLVSALASDEEPGPAQIEEQAAAPDPTSPSSPTLPSPPGPIGGTVDLELCGEVAVIMLTMTATLLEEFDDFEDYSAAVADSRRTAAADLRSLATDDPQQRAALTALADELDATAQVVEDNPTDIGVLDETFDRVSSAYADFNASSC